MSLTRLKNKLTKEFKRTKKLWKIHRIALLDLRAAENSPLCNINMNLWMLYSPTDKKCYVCMAGSVLRRRFFDEVIDKTMEGVTVVSKNLIDNKMRAINSLRVGRVCAASYILNGYSNIGDSLDRKMPNYKYKDPTWWKAQWKLNRDLRRANI